MKLNFYVVTCLVQTQSSIGYRTVFISAPNENEATGLGYKTFVDRCPDADVSQITATLINREMFEDVGIDPIEYFSRNENE